MIRRPPRSTQSRSSAASDVYKRQAGSIAGLYRPPCAGDGPGGLSQAYRALREGVHRRLWGGGGGGNKISAAAGGASRYHPLSLIHISEPTRRTPISYAVFCLK